MSETVQNQIEDILDALHNPAIDAYRLENDRRKNPAVKHYGEMKLLDPDEYIRISLFYVFTEFGLYYAQSEVFRQICLPETLCIAAGAPEIIVAAVLAVHSIPGVGQADGFALRQGSRDRIQTLCKDPVLVDIQNISHDSLSLRKERPGRGALMIGYWPLLSFRTAVFSATFFLLRG